MTGAVALAVVLVIAVVGASMAMEGQRAAGPTGSRPARPAPRPAPARKPKGRARGGADPTSADAPPAPAPQPEVKALEPLRSGQPATARVVSVVDERTIGPVTRSRLALKVEPAAGDAFEVTVRVAFQTPESRAAVKVGGTISVRYDPDDRSRVVVDLPQP